MWFPEHSSHSVSVFHSCSAEWMDRPLLWCLQSQTSGTLGKVYEGCSVHSLSFCSHLKQQNYLLSAPVCSELNNVQSPITVLLWHWRKLKNINILNGVLLSVISMWRVFEKIWEIIIPVVSESHTEWFEFICLLFNYAAPPGGRFYLSLTPVSKQRTLGDPRLFQEELHFVFCL